MTPVARFPYTGRFAPSPTGPLHAGSLVAALASWLDARAHGGRWLLRIEDVDTPRCIPGADTFILRQLADCGLQPDDAVLWQSRRGALYQQALDRLSAAGLAYPCGCSRKDIAAAQAAQGVARARHAALPYPGTCRDGLHGKPARAWRFNTGAAMDRAAEAPTETAGHLQSNTLPPWGRAGVGAAAPRHALHWQDRRLGAQRQDVCAEVGDFVLKRADGPWAYQLAVVVDDGAQGITHIVRGQDLADNTPRQILLQRALGLPLPRYLHTPLVLGPNGEKLSKQNGAATLDTRDPLAALNAAATVLELPARPGPPGDALAAWIAHWRSRWVATPP